MKRKFIFIIALLVSLTAAGTAFGDCRWNDDDNRFVAEWDSMYSNVKLQLYKGDSYKVGNKIGLKQDTTSYDLTQRIKSCGPGSYKFTVTDEVGRVVTSDFYQVGETVLEEIGTLKWKCVNGAWKLVDGVGNYLRGWQKVEDKWYYLDVNTGTCLLNTVTPDGYTVGPDGAWTGK